MIHDEIRTLLDSPPAGAEAPTIDDIEHTLTAGYAKALALEAERWRLERRIGELARQLGRGDTAERAAELSKLSRRLARADEELRTLRSALTRLRRHADAVRAA